MSIKKSINKFMKKNKIAIITDVDNVNDIFNIYKINLELESYDLFEQLILFSNVSDLVESVSDQLMPRIWQQGNTKCVICKPSAQRIVCLFYNSQLKASENYLYVKKLCKELQDIFTIFQFE